jgi:dTDP-4-amino-4,6-dideoxygalactose transaminase
MPNAERLANEIISLPLFPGMSDSQIDRCVDALHDAIASVGSSEPSMVGFDR